MAAAGDGAAQDPILEGLTPNPAELDGVPHLSNLIYLEEGHVLYNTKVRYNKDLIYSSLSNILIALNPYRSLPIYGPEVIAKYSGVKQALHHKLPPHIYATSEAAYANLMRTGTNQSMLVCGESGSGKTESAKLLMRHLAFTTQDSNASADAQEAHSLSSLMIEQQVLAANPILESLGNARTGMNANSSRFGKFTKLLFGAGGRIRGSFIETYLLERSRVVRQEAGERNFHSFYQVIAGLGDERRRAYGLGKPEDFHYLAQSGCVTIEGVSDHGRFEELCSAMDTLRFSREEQEQLFRVVAAVLHIGNVGFAAKDDSAADGCDVAEAAAKHLDAAAELLGVPPADLRRRLTFRTIKVPGQTIEKPLAVDDAVINRDAMAKGLYNALFKWVVGRINRELYTSGDGESLAANGASDDDDDDDDISRLLWIGILDVFGFESFLHNSFEQLCINFANERLQQFFNEAIIVSEQEEYQRQGIEWEPIECPDNSEAISLVDSKPYGVLAMLDSACTQPKGSHETFTATLFEHHPKHPKLRRVMSLKVPDGGKKKTAQRRINGFAIHHYAGEVVYNAEAFLAKNADSSQPDVVKMLCESRSEVVAELLRDELPPPPGAGGGGGRRRGGGSRFRSVGSTFSRQLAVLLKQLQSTTPFFVRCVNPNTRKRPQCFDAEHVRAQLRCGGMVEALRVLKLGYPTRAEYTQIYARYGKILDSVGHGSINERDFCEAVLYAFDLEKADYQLGLTKVFFRPSKAAVMEKIMKDNAGGRLPDEIVQKIRRYLIKKRIMRLKGVMKAYARWAVRMFRLRALRRFRTAGMQAMYLEKALVSRARAVRQLTAALTVQAYLRTYVAQREFKEWRDKSDAGAYIWSWYRRARDRRGLLRELSRRQAARVDAEKEREREERERREREEREERQRREKAEREERERAMDYFPAKPSLPYDQEELEPVVREVALWLARRAKRSVEGDLFDAIMDGVLLCDAAAGADPSSGCRANRKARPGTFFARENLKAFMAWAATLGLPHQHSFQAGKLSPNAVDHRAVLNALLNVAYLCVTQLGCESMPIVDSEVAAAEQSRARAEAIERDGISFFDAEGRFVDARQAAEEEERRAREEAEAEARRAEEEAARKAKEEAERKAREEEERRLEAERKAKAEEQEREREERQRLEAEEAEAIEEEESKLNANLLPQPTPRRGRVTRRESAAQEESFFHMTAAAVLRKLEEEGVLNPDEWKDFSAADMYAIAREERVPWEKWGAWIEKRVVASLLIAKAEAADEADMYGPDAHGNFGPNGEAGPPADPVEAENWRLRRELARQSEQLQRAMSVLNAKFGAQQGHEAVPGFEPPLQRAASQSVVGAAGAPPPHHHPQRQPPYYGGGGAHPQQYPHAQQPFYPPQPAGPPPPHARFDPRIDPRLQPPRPMLGDADVRARSATTLPGTGGAKPAPRPPPGPVPKNARRASVVFGPDAPPPQELSRQLQEEAMMRDAVATQQPPPQQQHPGGYPPHYYQQHPQQPGYGMNGAGAEYGRHRGATEGGYGRGAGRGAPAAGGHDRLGGGVPRQGGPAGRGGAGRGRGRGAPGEEEECTIL